MHNQPQQIIKQIQTEELGILTLKTGITPNQVNQLIEYSNNDEAVIKNTTDSERFQNFESFTNWHQNNVTIYTLQDSLENLLGIIWLQSKPLPKTNLKPEFQNLDTNYYNHTFAIRLYNQARGKKLAKNLILTCIKDYIQTPTYKNSKKKGIWLQTSADNQPAINAYKSIFTQVSQTPEHNNSDKKIVMILDPKNQNLL
jgi:ribosomal protein S18 acetylase RimI-like enzyme